MPAALLPRLAAGTLAGLVTLAIFAGLDTLAVEQHAATVLAKGHATPATLAAAASAPVPARI